MKRFVILNEWLEGWNPLIRCAQNPKILWQRESHVVEVAGRALRFFFGAGPSRHHYAHYTTQEKTEENPVTLFQHLFIQNQYTPHRFGSPWGVLILLTKV